LLTLFFSKGKKRKKRKNGKNKAGFFLKKIKKFSLVPNINL